MERLLDEVSFEAPDLAGQDRLRSTRPTCAACWPTSSRTKTCRATSCDPFDSRAAAARESLAQDRPCPARASLRCACGKKGPPLAPFVRVPAPVTDVTPQRVGNDVYVSFTVPRPTSTARSRPTSRARGLRGHRRRSPADDRGAARAGDADRDAAGAADPAGAAAAGERLAAAAAAAAARRRSRRSRRGSRSADRRDARAGGAAGREAGRRRRRRRSTTGPSAFGPLVAPPPTQLPRRHYFVVA